MFKLNRALPAVLTGALVSGSAFAAPADVTAVTTAIGEASAPIALIGAAVLVVMVGIKVYKWIRRAM